jgi:hypothetical protein
MKNTSHFLLLFLGSISVSKDVDVMIIESHKNDKLLPLKPTKEQIDVRILE